MRNDSRLIGEDSPASPMGGHEGPLESERPDTRDAHQHDRQSHVVNVDKEAEGRRPDSPDKSRT